MGVTAGEVLGFKAPGAGLTVRIPIMLLDSANAAPVTGEAFDAAGMAVSVAKEGASTFTAFPTFGTDNWDEIGYGNYDLILRQTDATELALLDTVGHLRVYVKTDNTRGDTFLHKVNPADVVRDGDVAAALAAINLDHLIPISGAVTSLLGSGTDDDISFYCTGLDLTGIGGANDWAYRGRICEFTSGDNVGLSRSVRAGSDSSGNFLVVLLERLPFDLQVGDTFVMYGWSASALTRLDGAVLASTVQADLQVPYVIEAGQALRVQYHLRNTSGRLTGVDDGCFTVAPKINITRLHNMGPDYATYAVVVENQSMDIAAGGHYCYYDVSWDNLGCKAGDVISVEIVGPATVEVGGQLEQADHTTGSLLTSADSLRAFIPTTSGDANATVNIAGSISDAAPTASSFVTDLLIDEEESLVGALLIMRTAATSGFPPEPIPKMFGQSRWISAYEGATKTITLGRALTSVPDNGDKFVVIPRAALDATKLGSDTIDADALAADAATAIGDAVAAIDAVAGTVDYEAIMATSPKLGALLVMIRAAVVGLMENTSTTAKRYVGVDKSTHKAEITHGADYKTRTDLTQV